jgi:hypothetical protein
MGEASTRVFSKHFFIKEALKVFSYLKKNLLMRAFTGQKNFVVENFLSPHRNFRSKGMKLPQKKYS